jgi:elongator complex protein 1
MISVALLNGVAYQPSAGYIGGFERSGSSTRVIFWEKNGLRHLEFDLPDFGLQYECIDLAWSTDSSILALQLDFNEPAKGTSRSTAICLYVRSNFKWYLKRILRSTSPFDDHIPSIRWMATTKAPTLLLFNK